MRETFRYSIFAGLLTLALFLAPFDLISNAQPSVGQEVQAIASALDENQNRMMDDAEILITIQLWILGDLATNSDPISDAAILGLVQLWITGETLSVGIMSDDGIGTTPFRFRSIIGCNQATGTELTQWTGNIFGPNSIVPDSFQPDDVAVDWQGANVYIVDAAHSNIQWWQKDSKFETTSGYTLNRKWGSFGQGDGQFAGPRGVVVDSQTVDRPGDVYVADTGNHRIQRFSGNSAFITKWGSFGHGDGQFWEPVSIAVDGLGNVYVADLLNDRIQKFNSDGAYLTQWQSSLPIDVEVDPQNNVYVANSGSIQKFDSNGTFIGTIGTWNSDRAETNVLGKFRFLVGIAVADDGKIYAADNDIGRSGRQMIHSYHPNGTPINSWLLAGNPAIPGVESHWSASIRGLTVDGGEGLYVGDPGKNLVRKFCTGDGQIQSING